jgi:16S rRNA processing protein RimM
MILVGEFGRAVGLKGEIRVKSLTGDPEALVRYGPLYGADGARFTPLAHRHLGENMLAVRFREIATREEAEALNRRPLHVPRAALPQPGEEEYYLADLIGLAVEDEAGAAIGEIEAVHAEGDADILKVRLADGRLIEAPFTRARVPVVDLAGGRIVLAEG